MQAAGDRATCDSSSRTESACRADRHRRPFPSDIPGPRAALRHRRRVETVDQQAGLLVDAQCEGPLDMCHAAALEKLLRGTQKGGEYLGLVFGAETTEMTNASLIAPLG